MNDDVKKFFGWILMIIGGLFALLTGGCGLIFMASAPKAAGFFVMIAGIPCLAGYGLFAWGRYLLPKKNDKMRNKNDTND